MALPRGWQEQIARVVPMVQIIVAALAAGPTLFLAIVLILPGGGGDRQGEPILVYAALAVAAVGIALRLLVPARMTARRIEAIARGEFRPGGRQSMAAAERFLERTGDAGLLFYVFTAKTIVSGALLEGPALLLVVAGLVEGESLALVVAGVLIAGVASLFPTRAGVTAWIESRLAEVDRLRTMPR